ncbi:hypothetical protein [Sphingobium sp. Z007]|uniref:hypothetical protein n=1 Tax=Sphingobium sp. Z007 TaxID=627495 RepID=UPI000B49AB06|nr:hypothetical protein [Sphingobium sp. Z007]
MAKIKKTAEEGSIGFKQAAQVALFIVRNWKIISTALAVFIPATAALTGKLQPVADAIAIANPL